LLAYTLINCRSMLMAAMSVFHQHAFLLLWHFSMSLCSSWEACWKQKNVNNWSPCCKQKLLDQSESALERWIAVRFSFISSLFYCSRQLKNQKYPLQTKNLYSHDGPQRNVLHSCSFLQLSHFRILMAERFIIKPICPYPDPGLHVQHCMKSARWSKST